MKITKSLKVLLSPEGLGTLGIVVAVIAIGTGVGLSIRGPQKVTPSSSYLLSSYSSYPRLDGYVIYPNNLTGSPPVSKAQALEILRRDSPMPLGARGTSLTFQLDDAIIPLKASETMQPLGIGWPDAVHLHVVWVATLTHAPIIVYGPSTVSATGTWTAMIDARTGHVMIVENFSGKGTVRAKSSTTVLKPGTIVAHRFVKSINLSDGALTLTPFRGVTPHLSYAEETLLWATDGLSGTVEGVGFADVTLKLSTTKVQTGPRISTLDDTPSLVELTKSEGVYSCTAQTAGEGTSVVPVSQGWYAVILPLNPGKSDVVFRAASNVCRQLTPNTVGAAYEDVSITWHLATHPTTGTVIVALLPKCGHIIMSGGGGNEFTRKFEYQVEAAILERSPGTACSPATEVDEGQNYATPSTTHGFVGPVLNVGPHAGKVMTPEGPRQQPLV